MSSPNKDPIYPDTILLGHARLATGNTDLTGATGTLVTLATGGTKGTRVDRVGIHATATTSQGKIYVFKTDASGINPRLYDVVDVTVAAPDATVSPFSADLVRADGLPYCTLVSGQLLRLAPRLSEAFDCVAEGGDF